MLESDRSGLAVEPEDQDLVDNLAKLQNMYNQVSLVRSAFSLNCVLTSTELGGLRTLLPEKLINPTRFALENPEGYEPEKLAAYLQTAAQEGSRDVEKFKRDWHSDKVRELWQNVHSNEFPQGGDAWPLDYITLSRVARSHEQKPEGVNGTGGQPQPQAEDDVASALSTFKARHPDAKLQPSDDGKVLPLDLNLSQMDFRIDSSSSRPTLGYTVSSKPGAATSSLQSEIILRIRSIEGSIRLITLLV